MPPSSPVVPPEQLIDQLAGIEAGSAQQDFFKKNPQAQQREMVLRIVDEVTRAAREDLTRAERLAAAATWLSELLQDDFCRARSARAVGNLQVLRGKNADALQTYAKSIELFERLGDEVEAAITRSSSLQPLIYLGIYAEAFERSQRAREVFEQHGDALRLARLEVNIGNILHRQDRFAEALEQYRHALASLERLGERRDCAVVLGNMEVCAISLHDFPMALETYEKGRAISEQENMPTLVAQADYNIAYLYYLRGEHTRAIQLYQATRVYCDRVGDSYHRALCDLDQAELYLELNLAPDGAQLAQQAFARFDQMGLGYEAAKALVFLGVAAYLDGKAFRALELFAKARARLAEEQNSVWPALLDLYQALVLYQEGRMFEAQRACVAAQESFGLSHARGKVVLSNLLLAALHLDAGAIPDAEAWSASALRQSEELGSPGLLFHVHWVRGRLLESQGRREQAKVHYQKALEAWEALPSRRQAEELKIPFSKDRLALYEALVSLRAGSAEAAEAVFELIEKAKSRELAELIAFRGHALPAPAGTRSDLAEKIKNLREELNWYYRQVDLAELRTTERAAEQAEALRKKIRESETALLGALSEPRATDEEFLALQNATTTPLAKIRELLEPDEVLLEYYEARGSVYVVIVGRQQTRVVPLTRIGQVRELLRLLHSQFARCRLSVDYLKNYAEPMLESAQSCLRELAAELIAPLREDLCEKRLIIVPHGVLHYLPFHALLDGSRYLGEDHLVSYAGSASRYFLSASKNPSTEERSLVLAPGGPGPDVYAEQTVALERLLPNARVRTGSEASLPDLESFGPGCRFIHLAVRMRLRQDNLLFSTLALGGASLTILDAYHLRLPCELISLAGTGSEFCVTGSAQELNALARGLEYAGARTVLMPLWNVEGEPAAKFLQTFYTRALANADKGQAMRDAMAAVRQEFPHPFYWASYVLRGWPH